MAGAGCGGGGLADCAVSTRTKRNSIGQRARAGVTGMRSGVCSRGGRSTSIIQRLSINPAYRRRLLPHGPHSTRLSPPLLCHSAVTFLIPTYSPSPSWIIYVFYKSTPLKTNSSSSSSGGDNPLPLSTATLEAPLLHPLHSQTICQPYSPTKIVNCFHSPASLFWRWWRA